MNFWKKIGCLGLSAAMLFGMAGCTEPEETTPTDTEETRPSINGYDWENPGHYAEQINEFLSIDATIRGPKDGQIPAIYEMAQYQYTSDDLGPFLEAIDDSIESVQYEETKPETKPGYPEFHYYNYLGKTKKGASISSSWHALTPDALPYGMGDRFFMYQHYPEQKNYLLFAYRGMDSIQEDPYKKKYRNSSSLFTEPKEFSFGSAEDFEDEMLHLLELADIHDLQIEHTFYLDYESMNAALENPDYFIDTEVFYPDGIEFTEDMNAYAYIFTQMKDGIPVLHHSFERVTVTYYQPTMEAICNKNGILYMELWDFFTFGDVLEVPERIMTADEALDKAMSIIQKSNPPFRRIVDDISIQYYPYQDRDQWTYRPCWVIAVLNPDKVFIGPAPDHTIILLDAITGKEI